MPKEIVSIQHLKRQRKDYSNLAGRRQDFVRNLGKEQIKNADISIVATILTTRKKADQIIEDFPNKIKEIDKELKLYENAKRYIDLTTLGIDKIYQLKKEGYLSENDQLSPDIQKSLTEFEELEKQKESDPIFRSWLDKLKEETVEEDGKEPELINAEPAPQKPLETTLEDEKEPIKFRLPNGELVGGKTGKLLTFLDGSSEQNAKTVNQIAENVYPNDKPPFRRTRSLITAVSKSEKINNYMTVELTNVPSFSERKRGKSSSYYLKYKQQSQDPDGLVQVNQVLPIESESELLTEADSKEEDKVGIITVSQSEISEDKGVEVFTEIGVSPFETQKPLSRVETFVQSQVGETKNLLEKVTKNADFIKAKEKASKALRTKSYTVERIGSDISGYLFETMAYLHLKDHLEAHGKVLLSPHESLEVYSLLYPGREIVNGIGLQIGIEGKSVPDGIIFDNKIAGIAEFSLNIVNARGFNNKLASLQNFQVKHINEISNLTKLESSPVSNYIHNKLPNTSSGQIAVSEDLKQYTVFPKGVNIASDDPRVEIIHIPVTRGVLREYINAFMSDITENSQEQNKTLNVPPETPENLPSIETPEFAGLSRAEIGLIALRLDSNREDLERLGIAVIDSGIVYKLIDDLTGGQMISGIDKMTKEERDKFIDKYRAEAFIKAKKIIKGPKFNEFMDNMPEKYSGVRDLLKNVFDINESLEKAGQVGITIISDDPEQLKMIILPQRKLATSVNDEVVPAKIEDAVRPVQESNVLVSAPANAISPGSEEQEINVRERRKKETSNELIKYFEDIIKKIGDRSLNAVVAGEMFNSLKDGTIHKALTGKWIPKKREGGSKGGDLMFNPVDIATMLFIAKNNVQNPNLRKEAYKIAKRTYKDVLKKRNSR